MTNREKLYEIAGRLGADADLVVVRAALLALIRVLLGVATEPIVLEDGFRFSCATADADDARAAYRAKWLSVLEALGLPPGDFDAVGAILRLRRDIEKARIERVATLGGALTKPGTAREPPEQRGSAIDDILRERDAMVARSRRGIQRDDERGLGGEPAQGERPREPDRELRCPVDSSTHVGQGRRCRLGDPLEGIVRE